MDAGNNTDNNATFLLAVGYIWDEVNDASLFLPLLTQLQDALIYVKTAYNVTDKHVLVIHPHDYLEEYAHYTGEFNTGLVKYESFIDVIWAAGLQKAAPIFAALGDTTNYNYCITTSAELLVGLEDYRDNDLLYGGLHYAIKTDDLLYNTVIFLDSNLYAAHLLNDAGAKTFLQSKEMGYMLGLRAFDGKAPIVTSNWLGSTDWGKKDYTWAVHLPIVAGELAKLGDYSLVPSMHNSLPFTGFPELVESVITSHGVLRRRMLLCDLFTWANGELVELCNVLADLEA